MVPHQHVQLPQGFNKPAGVASIAQDTLLVADSSRIFAVQVFDKALRVPCKVTAWLDGGNLSRQQQQPVEQQQGAEPQQQFNTGQAISGNLLDGTASMAAFTDIGAIAYDDCNGVLYVLDDGFIRKINITSGLVADTVTTLQPRLFERGGQGYAMVVVQPPAGCSSSPSSTGIAQPIDAPLLLIGHGGQLTCLNLTDYSTSIYAGTTDVGHRDGAGPDFSPADMRFNGIAGLAVGAYCTTPTLPTNSNAVGNWPKSCPLYLADSNNHCVRRFHIGGPTERVDTWLGVPGAPGNIGGAAGRSDVRFNWPLGLCVDGDSQLFISDHRNQQVLQVDPCGTARKLVPDVVPGPPELSSSGNCNRGPWQMAVTHQGHLAVMWLRQDMPACLCLYGLGFTPRACSSQAQAAPNTLRSDMAVLLESGADADLCLQV
jgi:hypothetical protein